MPAHREPAQQAGGLESRAVWALPYGSSLLASVEEITEAADAASSTAALLRRVRTPIERGRSDIVSLTQRELAYAGVQGVGGAWGGNAHTSAPAPR